MDSSQRLTISIPITNAMQRRAQAIAQSINHVRPNSALASRTRQNALAAQVVDFYLQMIDAPVEESALEDLGEETWSNHLPETDSAMLKLKNLRRLECRAIKKGDRACHIPTQIPPEVVQNRLGCLVVELDEDEKEGTILGYVPNGPEATIAVEELQSLDTFLEQLHEE